MSTQTSRVPSQARGLIAILIALALTLVATAPVQARNTETEPNNDAESATVLDAELTLSGRFDDSRDHDFIAFSLDRPLRLWRLQAAGEGVKSLTLYDPGGNKVATAARSGKIARVSSLLLPPGRYLVDIAGDSGHYLFRAIDQGPPPVAVADAASEGAADQTTHQATGAGTGSGARPDFELNEIEPNDTLGRAMALLFDHRRTGALDRKGDHDSYRFTLTGPTHITLEFEPIDQPLRADLIPSWGSDKSQALKIAIPAVETATPMPLTWSALLTAGDYLLVLQARKPTEWPYALTLRRRPWFDRPADLEPNNSPEQARQIPASGLIDGLFTDGVDYYALPVTDSQVDYRFMLSGPGTGPGNKKPKVNLRARVLEAAPGNWEAAQWKSHRQLERPALGDWRLTVPAHARVVIGLSGNDGAYAVRIEGWQAPPATTDIAAGVTLDNPHFAAFARRRQTVSGTLALTNSGPEPRGLTLAPRIEHALWHIELAQDRVEIPAAATIEVPITVTIAPDAWDQQPVWLSIAALNPDVGAGASADAIVNGSTDSERLATAEARLSPDPDLPPLDPGPVWTLPEPMLGGLNLAWSALDAKVAEKQEKLIDGPSVAQASLALSLRSLQSRDLSVDLAGDHPVAVAGILLTHPQGGVLRDRLMQDFRIEASASAADDDFRPVLSGRMSVQVEPQPFVFPTPVEARRLRLIPLNNRSPDGIARGVVIGDFKAIGNPSQPLPDGRAINLADPRLGGHVVYNRPTQSLDKLLQQTGKTVSIHRPKDSRTTPPKIVIGFRDGRAAAIDGLAWMADKKGHATVTEVMIETSLASPFGPWTPLAQSWRLTPEGDSELRFKQPIWARYLRLTIAVPDGQARLLLPDQLRVFERPAGPDYRSMVGEWTEQGSEAVYEWLHPVRQPAMVSDSGDDLATATPLPLATEQRETVQIDHDQDWRRIDIPEPGGLLTLVLSGEPTVEAVLTLLDASGEVIPFDGDRSEPGRIVYRGYLPPGTVYARIVEPPRSMVISWDTSGSVSAYIDQITAGVRGFAHDLVPGRDEINLLPFAPNPALLLDEWTGDPAIAMQALHSYDRRRMNSSNAELAMLRASEALKMRDGVHAILIVTDLKSPGADLNTTLWDSLNDSRARVFAVAVPSASHHNTPRRTHEIFRDWTVPGGGYLDYLTGEGRISVAFRRAAAWLRRPAAYGLSATLVPGEPEPATLRVTADPGALAATHAVEVILDGSGSMRKRIDGVARYRVARDALIALTTDTLPAGMPFTLRVFGKGGAGSCRTDLEVPLGPLDPARVKAAIKGFTPINLAKTPIGASLAAVADDLRDAEGSAIVVLLTDGEETCGGDPAAAIERLHELGIQVQVNIVGFALDDDALKAQFSDWAQRGNGRYFDANDATGLRTALREAIAVRYRVMRGAELVTQGTVNGPALDLPPGTYRIELDGGDSKTVRLDSGGSETIDLGAQRP